VSNRGACALVYFFIIFYLPGLYGTLTNRFRPVYCRALFPVHAAVLYVTAVPQAESMSAAKKSRALNAGGVAAGRRKVDVQVGRARIGEQPRDGALELLAVGQFEADHHRFGIEGAHREGAVA